MKDEKFILDTDLGSLICGDALQILPTFKTDTFDAVITDPPFAFAGGISTGRTSVVDEQFFLHWWKDICQQFNRILKKDAEGFVWCDWQTAYIMSNGFEYQQEYGLRAAQVIFHHRKMVGQGSPFRNSVDMILYLRGYKSKGHRIPKTTQNWISKYWYYGKHKYHPSEKDVEIARQLVKWCSDKNDLIIDPFCGSGTTLLACELEQRRYIGIEISEKYCDVAKSRLLELRKQATLPKFRKTEIGFMNIAKEQEVLGERNDR